MKTKTKLLQFMVALLLSPSPALADDNIPSFIFKLGTPLSEVQIDSRMKSCKDMGAIDDEGNSLENAHLLSCKNVEKLHKLQLLFLSGKLVMITGNFHENSQTGFKSAVTLAIINQKTNTDVDPILLAAKAKCEALGKTTKVKSNHARLEDGTVLDQFSERLVKDQYVCLTSYSIYDQSVVRTKEPNIFTIPDFVFVSNIKELNAAKEARKKKSIGQFNF